MLKDLGLLSIGVLIIIIAVSLATFAAGLILADQILQIFIISSGAWILILAGIRFKNPKKHIQGALGLFSWGILLIAFGGSWILYSQGLNLLYSLAIVLIVLGLIAVIAALNRK